MFGVTDYWGFLLGAALIVLLPGPNSMYVLSTATRHGLSRGYRAAAGVALGDSLLMVASVGGAASLLRSHHTIFEVVKHLGGAYLVWIGVGLVRAAIGAIRGSRPAHSDRTHGPVETATSDSVRPQVRWRHDPFVAALTLCLLNPKSILFFVAFFVQFIDPADPHPVRGFLVLAATMQVVSLLYLSGLIVGGAYLGERFRRHSRASAGAKAGIGLVFMTFGITLATST